jgi:hypothetical protein
VHVGIKAAKPELDYWNQKRLGNVAWELNSGSVKAEADFASDCMSFIYT